MKIFSKASTASIGPQRLKLCPIPGQTRRHRVKKTSALDIGAHVETRALDARMHPGETSWMDHIFLLKFASIGLFLSDQLGLVVYNENIKKNKLNHKAPPSPNRHCKRHLLPTTQSTLVRNFYLTKKRIRNF